MESSPRSPSSTSSVANSWARAATRVSLCVWALSRTFSRPTCRVLAATRITSTTLEIPAMAKSATESSDYEGEPRICMPIFSSFARQVHRAGLYEAHDVLIDCDDVDVIRLEPTRALEFGEKVLKRLVYRDVFQKLVFINPGLRSVRLTREYEVFLLVCQFLPDVWYSNAIQGWRDHCRISICWISELWISNLQDLGNWLPILSKFDYVIVGVGGSGKVLETAIRRPCYEVPGGVDALRFSPYPNPPARVVDVYSIGRRWEGIHRQFLAAAAKEIFYIYDTLEDVADGETRDYAAHRNLYASIAKRSRFFTVAPAKMNATDETQGQISFGPRYFEASTAGAVLVGQAPNTDAFRRYFDWPNPVVNIRPDGSDAVEVMSRLVAEPERLGQMSRRNAEEGLRRHDWVYRWKEILGIAGLKTTEKMRSREKRLGELAEMARESNR